MDEIGLALPHSVEELHGKEGIGKMLQQPPARERITYPITPTLTYLFFEGLSKEEHRHQPGGGMRILAEFYNYTKQVGKSIVAKSDSTIPPLSRSCGWMDVFWRKARKVSATSHNVRLSLVADDKKARGILFAHLDPPTWKVHNGIPPKTKLNFAARSPAFDVVSCYIAQKSCIRI